MMLLLYFALYLALAFVGRSVVVYRSTGQNPFVLPSGDDACGYVGRAFRMLTAAVVIFVVLNAVRPDLLDRAGRIRMLETAPVAVLGWMLLLVSLAWLLVAQAQMGNSWRIGIDVKTPTSLVSSGLFAISRNPIFLAMRVNLLGLFFVVPSAVTLAAGAAGEILMQVQVRLEEAHLSALHGEAYAQYRARVRRWL